MLSQIYGRSLEPGEILGKSGIEYVPSMDIHDPSKLQAFMASPRAYFFNHVLGLSGRDPNNHLSFGSAWHDAMEHLLLSLEGPEPYGTRAIKEAFELFMQTYRRDFPNEYMDEENAPKNPAGALRGLVEYVSRWYATDVGHIRPLYTEIAVSVPVAEDRVVFGKLDSIVIEDETWIKSLEHKTTQKKMQTWIDQWDLILQPLIYTHVLRTYYEDDEQLFNRVKGVEINGMIFRTKDCEVIRVPTFKTDQQMSAGLWAVNHWLDQIQWNFENLLETSPDDDVMPAFPCNGTACSSKPWGCPYSSLCSHWPNPLQHLDSIPPAFTKEYWDPRRLADDAKNVLHLEEGKEIKVANSEV